MGLAVRRTPPPVHEVDAGYATAARILDARDEHGIDLVGPLGADAHQTRHGLEFLSQSAFLVEWEKRQVTCPQGAISSVWSTWRKPATGLNLIRLDAWWTGTPIGSTRTSHFARRRGTSAGSPPRRRRRDHA